MKSPLELTFEVLVNSRNESANEVLLTAFQWENGPLFIESLKTILARRNKEAHTAVLQRWHELGEPERQLILKSHSRISGALRDAILSEDSLLFTNACQVVEHIEDYDLVPNLVALSEHTTSPHAKEAAALVLRLTERLSALLKKTKKQNETRDPRVYRKSVLECLKRSLERYRYHKRPELLEAFSQICESNDEFLLTILDDPHHPCFKDMSHAFASSANSAVIDLLLKMLQGEKVPATILSIVSHRTDRKFICRMLEYCDQAKSTPLSRSLKRLRSLSWLNVPSNRLSTFCEADQVLCVHMLSASGVSPDAVLDSLEELLLAGEPAGRAAACEALAEFPGDHTNHLILQAVYDTSPPVQAAATRQLRDRHIPGTMPLLSDLLDGPHEEVRNAAREALAEFSFENFVKNYDSLSEEARQTTGSFVQRVDEEYLALLKNELSAQGVKPRLRAIEIAQLLEVVPFVVDDLLTLLTDNDHVVRAAAAEALKYWPVPEVQAALEIAALDRSGTVQNAARNSLAVFGSFEQPTSPDLVEARQ